MIRTPNVKSYSNVGNYLVNKIANSSVHDLQAENSSLKTAIQRLTYKIKETEQEIQKLQNEKEYLIDSISYENERSTDIDKNIEMYKQQNESLDIEISHLRSQKSKLDVYQPGTRAHLQLLKDFEQKKERQKELTEQIYSTSRSIGLLKESSTEEHEISDIDTEISTRMTSLNSRVDSALVSPILTPRNNVKERGGLVLNISEYRNQPSQKLQIQKSFEFQKNIKQVEYKQYEGAITWESILKEVKRITDNFNYDAFNIAPFYGSLPETTSEVREKLVEIESSKDELLEMQPKLLDAEDQLDRARAELDLARIQLENEEYAAEKDVFMESEINIEIELLETQMASKRKEIGRIQKAIADSNRSLAQQSRLRNDLQHNLNDLILKEKPEISSLSAEVETWRVSLKDITDRLDAAETELKQKEDKLKELQINPTVRQLMRMKEKKLRTEKKIQMLKIAIKKEDTPRDDYPQIVERNAIKIRSLRDQIDKLERQQRDEQNEIRELTYYSDYITAFFRDKNKK